MAHRFLHGLATSITRFCRTRQDSGSGKARREFEVRVAEFGPARAVQPGSPALHGRIPEPRVPEEPVGFPRP